FPYTTLFRSGLRAVVELVREIASVEGVQHGGARVLVGPHDAVGAAVGRDRGRAAGVGEARRAPRGSALRKARRRGRECEETSAARPVVERAVEPGGRRPDAPAEDARELLPDVVAAGAEAAHRVAVDDVEVAVLAGADHEMARGAG